MNRVMVTATNTLSQLQKKIDVVSNNIANINTTGYKAREATFTELMVQQVNNQRNVAAEIGRLTPNGIRLGTGAKIAQTQFVFLQGPLKTTERPLDVAFTKENQLFKIAVQQNDGTEIQYTRNGAFHLTPISDTEVALVTGEGHFVLDENENPIYLGTNVNSYGFNSNGDLTVSYIDGTEETFSLGIVQVNNPQFLEAKGNNLYGLPVNFAELGVDLADVLVDLVGAERSEIGIQQGALEQSNVRLEKEMSDLIQAQRGYQFQSRSISIADQMQGLVNGIR